VVSLALLCCGCSGEDADRLARIGGKLAAQAEGLAAQAEGKLALGWQAVQAQVDEAGVDARVAARLRWDKELAQAEIQVQVNDGAVELIGTVADEVQRRRAVELAEATVGVEQVVDALEVAPPEPGEGR
jgi:osmotically-inducible protein OsmY